MENDGSSRITALKSEILQDSAGFLIKQIGYNKLKTLVNKSDTSWVILWAPWCAPCISNILDGHYLEKADKLNVSEENLIFISTNYDLASINKYLNDGKHPSVTYVLDAKKYGKDESKKINDFTLQLANDSARGVPQHFIFKNGQLLHYEGGRLNLN